MYVHVARIPTEVAKTATLEPEVEALLVHELRQHARSSVAPGVRRQPAAVRRAAIERQLIGARSGFRGDVIRLELRARPDGIAYAGYLFWM